MSADLLWLRTYILTLYSTGRVIVIIIICPWASSAHTLRSIEANKKILLARVLYLSIRCLHFAQFPVLHFIIAGSLFANWETTQIYTTREHFSHFDVSNSQQVKSFHCFLFFNFFLRATTKSKQKGELVDGMKA